MEKMIDFILARFFRNDYRCKNCKRYTDKTDFFFNRNGDGFCVVSEKGARFYATVNRNDKICRRFQK
jgi:hypothetical protein